MNRLASSESIPVGGLTPGSVLAGRYRIVGLLGRGGMGEVYRADDTKLGQTVALKFLPRDMSADPVRRERFFAEVRITRQLSHPNICRVYDVADVDGRYFLSMEFIDGEDLASLLKRIGSLSSEKALAVARQLCAGLAAAHAGGVLHRDLKPANIMIDGHGRARITDFGLAVGMASEPVEGEVAGTPAYMAPEQLAGKGASVRSDIYALGLVLYEVCCGRRAFTAKTLAELRDQKEHTTPPPPSDIRPGMDLVVERVILRCLERDPRARPASVTQLAASLPGGDPLAAAIAAGETPSPELVAASGLKEGLAPPIAVALLAVIVLGSLAAVWMSDRTGLVAQVRPSRTPDAMMERARQVLAKAGHPETAREGFYSVAGFYADDDVVRYVQQESVGAARAARFRALGAVGFFTRQSPAPLFNPQGMLTGTLDPGAPLQEDGEVSVLLDAEGRLRSFAAIPVQSETGAGTLNWADLLVEAGVNPQAWTSVEPRQTPRFFVDTRVAWQGPLSADADVPVRIEATAFQGRLVTFDIVGPWRSNPSRGAVRAGAASTPGGARLLQAPGPIAIAIVAVIFWTGAFFARRNVRAGRGDRRGATRLALFGGVATLGPWVLYGHHVVPFVSSLGVTVSLASCVWLFYVAVEPLVRRRWPGMLVAWVRVLAGNVRDPLVGRDVLIGCASGVVGACLTDLNRLAAWRAGQPGALLVPDWNMFNGTGGYVSSVLAALDYGLFVSLLMLFVYFLLRLVLRSDWAAIPLLVLFAGTSRIVGTGSWVAIPVIVASGGLRTIVLVRVGLVAAIVDAFVWTLFQSAPMTLQTSAWYAGLGYASLAVVGALAVYGFQTAVGSRPMLGGSDSV